jgi:hypothetical protein
MKNAALEKQAKEEGVKFIHLRRIVDADLADVDMHGGATVAFKQNGREVIYAVARCTDRDNYCRRTGRIIAAGRLLKGQKITAVVLEPEESIYDVVFEQLNGKRKHD